MNSKQVASKTPRWLSALMAPAVALALAVTAGAANADVVSAGSINIERGAHKLMREANAVSRVAVGDPEVADVNVVNKRELLITGKKLGSTSLIIWTDAAPSAPRQYTLRIGPAPVSVKNDPEMAKAQIVPGQSLQGSLPNLSAHYRAQLATVNNGKDTVSDLSSVDLPTQVMTEVKIVEVSRNQMQQFGFNLFKNTFTTTGALAGPGGVQNVTQDKEDGLTMLISAVPLQSAYNLVLGSTEKGLFGVLSLLERKGMARVLAEPSLLATSGQTANYLAGGEFPVPVNQGGGVGSISIDYKEFGVRLALSPTVLARDRISLKVAPEVSDLDFSAGIQIGGVAVPALLVRRTDTTIELGDGESFVISGLVSNSLMNNVDKVPWLGNLPVLGTFFRSTSIRKEEKELIMIVTPRLVRPLARNAPRPALPGSQYDGYDPSFAKTMLLENGKFETGFSR